MPDAFTDRRERDLAHEGPVWLRELWMLSAAREGAVWALDEQGTLVLSPNARRRALAIFPSEAAALDFACAGAQPVRLGLDDLAASAQPGRLELWPAFQSAYHGGTVFDVAAFLVAVSDCDVDVRTQLSVKPAVSSVRGYTPLVSLASTFAIPHEPQKHPKAKPAAMMKGVLGSPPANRFKFMLSTTFWVAVTPTGPLGVVTDSGELALAVWPAPQVTPALEFEGCTWIKVGWGEAALRPLVESGISVMAFPTERDGLLCTPAWFALPDLVAI